MGSGASLTERKTNGKHILHIHGFALVCSRFKAGERLYHSQCRFLEQTRPTHDFDGRHVSFLVDHKFNVNGSFDVLFSGQFRIVKVGDDVLHDACIGTSFPLCSVVNGSTGF